MRLNKFRVAFFILFFVVLLSPVFAHAHEQYVLTSSEINADVAFHSPSVWSALDTWENQKIAIFVSLGSLLAFILYFLWERSALDQKVEKFMNKLEPFGHVILRVAVAVSLLFSAHLSVFLGPEIPLTTIPFGLVIKFVMYVLGIMILFGFLSELAGFAALIILLIATFVYKDYMLSYVNYLGEFLAYIVFGSRTFSLDRLLYGAKKIAQKYQKYDIALIRITYGISVMYPAIIYKILHPEVIIDIVNRYNLTQFHWLFPQDPMLIALGTGVAQIVVGICLILGFETRLNTLVTFGLMVLSVFFFKEAVWPHYILLALALYLIINSGGEWSLDHYIQKRKKSRRITA